MSNHYSTHDLCEASALKSYGFTEGLDRSNPKRASFYFDNTEELEEHKKLFWAGQLRVDPVVFYQSLRALKARIYSEQ